MLLARGVLTRVVEHLRLDWLAALKLRRVLVGKLPPDGAVAHRHAHGAHEDHGCLAHNVGAHPRQRAVRQRRVLRRHVDGRVGLDLGEAREGVEVRDADLVEQQEAVVRRLVALLGSNVADRAAGQHLARLRVADRHDEGVRAAHLALEHEAGHDNGVCGGAAETAAV